MKNSSEPEHFLSLRFRDDKRIRFGLGHCGCKDADPLQVLSVESIYNSISSKWMETFILFYSCILVTAFSPSLSEYLASCRNKVRKQYNIR